MHRKLVPWISTSFKGLIPNFGSLQCIGLPKVGIKLFKLSHARMFSYPKILFLVPLLFVALLILNSIPIYILNFKIFIILVHMYYHVTILSTNYLY